MKKQAYKKENAKIKNKKQEKMEDKNEQNDAQGSHNEFIAAITARIAEFCSSQIGFLIRNIQNSNSQTRLQSQCDYEEVQEKQSAATKKVEETKRKYAKARSRLPLDTECQRPKAPTSSFLIYYHQNKKELAAKFGVTDVSRLTKLASQVWKGLPAEKRAKYTKISEESKERYQKEMEEFKAKHHDKIEEALKKRRAEYRMNWLKKKGKEIKEKDKEDSQDSSSLSPQLSGEHTPK